MTGFQIILDAREYVCARLPKDLRLQFIKDLGVVFFHYEQYHEGQLELPLPEVQYKPKPQTEITLEDLGL